MFECFFALNGKPMSAFEIGGSAYPAFSGLGSRANKAQYACARSVGPLPPGRYYIVDRQQGGLLGPIRNFFNDHSQWFALYADDGAIDDEMFCHEVKRGNFRLHPKGPLGRSEGCITLNEQSHFHHIQALLRSVPPIAIQGSLLKAYGRVSVR